VTRLRRTRLAVFGTLVIISAFFPAYSVAQDGRVPGYPIGTVIAGNVILGAGIAAIGHIGDRHKAMQAALKGGAAGGLVFAGKWIVSQNNSSTNILGRQIAAVGSSAVRNAAAGEDFLHDVSLMYGPVRVHLTTGKTFSIQPRVDLASSFELWHAAHTRQLSFDPGRSFTSGVPIFEIDSAKRTGGLGGSHEGGVVRFRSKTPFQIANSELTRRIIGHELVHVTQFDFAFNTFAAPIEARIFRAIPGGQVVNQFLDLGLNVPLLSALNTLVPYRSRPWEREARTLATR
jgi:hypothetical protein